VEEAIAGYRQSLSLSPDSTAARSGLVRALFFRATFCGSSPEEKKRIFEEARPLGEEGVARLDAAAAGAEGAARAAALRRVPGAGEVVFWAAVACNVISAALAVFWLKPRVTRLLKKQEAEVSGATSPTQGATAHTPAAK
jgi:hypothetical protein